ncbi:MAG: hypothetical protein JO102_06910 [Elusimicrobia bacterium]|nr:hypothetical protein [Elusimicrobiota bacterium]
MSDEDMRWVRKAGIYGRLKKGTVMALIAVIGLALPLYQLFVRLFARRRPRD